MCSIDGMEYLQLAKSKKIYSFYFNNELFHGFISGPWWAGGNDINQHTLYVEYVSVYGYGRERHAIRAARAYSGISQERFKVFVSSFSPWQGFFRIPEKYTSI